MTDDFNKTGRDVAETEITWGYRLTRLETLGLLLILIAALGFFQIMFPLLLGFLFLTAPVAAHMIGRVAHRQQIPKWSGTVVDESLLNSASRDDSPDGEDR